MNVPTSAHAQRKPRPIRRALLRYVGVPVVTGLLLFGGYLGGIQLIGNFATVVPGEVYRSNQPDESELADYKTQYGIKTVINLRGGKAGVNDWYDEETAAAEALGIAKIDFPTSATKHWTKEQVLGLIEIMRTAEKPILLHCKSGSDRTGLAAALYLAAIAGQGEEVAERQLSIRFGHFSLPISDTYAMDQTFEDMEPLIGLK